MGGLRPNNPLERGAADARTIPVAAAERHAQRLIDAFDAVEKAGDTMLLAGDILLDALFLDPAADAFLEQRADMLFANGGARLLRLLRRLEHVASVTGINPEAPGALSDFSLYLEAQFRTPIVSRWPAIARFLTKYRDAVAALTSPIVSGICERWLTTCRRRCAMDRPCRSARSFPNLRSQPPESCNRNSQEHDLHRRHTQSDSPSRVRRSN